MLKLFYFFRGYLLIRVSGACAERFMNLCGIRRMMLWDVKQDMDSYTMCISLKSFFLLRDIVRKTSTRVVVLKRIGLPFLWRKVRNRWFFLIFVLLVALVFFLSQFLLWDIRIEGNQEIAPERIGAFLEERGVKKGILKNRLDTKLLEKELRGAFSQITWVSVYLDGNSLMVHLKENDKPIPPEETQEEKAHKEGFIEEETGMDVCAAKNGTVVSIVTRTGTPLVSPGDTVQVGDVLIRGAVEIYDNEGNVRERVKVHADGDIMIEGFIRTTFQTDAEKSVTTASGRSKRYLYIRWGDTYRVFCLFQIPYEHYQAIPHAYQKSGEKSGLLFEAGEMEVSEQLLRREEKTKEEYETELLGLLEEYTETLQEKAIQIRSKNVTIKKNGGTVILTAALKVQGPFFERKETEELPLALPETADE